MTLEQAILEGSLDLLWSQWSELGVPGLRPKGAPVAVSPIDLVLYTPAILGDRDPRLAGLVQAWCAQHGARAFGARELRGRRESLPDAVRRAFDRWAAPLHQAVGSPWPSPEAPVVAEAPMPTARDLPFRADRPACVHLRSRALFGLGVRSDVVCGLLEAESRGQPLTSRDLAHLGHTPRAVQLTFAALETAGLVVANREGRTHSWRLSRARELAALLDAADVAWVPWHHVLPVLSRLVALAEAPSPEAAVRRVRAHAVARELSPHAHALRPLRIRPGDEEAHDTLLAWGADVLSQVRGL